MARITARNLTFIDAYIRLDDGSKAYREAYDCSNLAPVAVARKAWELLNRHDIKDIVKERRAKLSENSDDLTKKIGESFAVIANMDMSTMSGLAVICCRRCWGEGFREQWALVFYLEACEKAERNGDPIPDPGGGLDYDHSREPNPACPGCKGFGEFVPYFADTRKLTREQKMVFGGVKLKANGAIEYIVADQMKARELHAKIFGALSDSTRPGDQIPSMIAVHKISDDPNEAVRQYQQIMKSIAPKGRPLQPRHLN